MSATPKKPNRWHYGPKPPKPGLSPDKFIEFKRKLAAHTYSLEEFITEHAKLSRTQKLSLITKVTRRLRIDPDRQKGSKRKGPDLYTQKSIRYDHVIGKVSVKELADKYNTTVYFVRKAIAHKM